MKEHLISVIIPTYNRANYICEAIDSVLAQTYKNVEIIVVDDGSTDNTRDIISQRYNSKVTYILQNNAGPSSARNNGIKHSRGDLIAFLDSDDIWLPEKLEKQVELINQSQDIGLVSCGLYQIDPNGNIIGNPLIRRNYKNKSSFLKELMIHNIIGGGSSSLIRRECFERVGFFDEEIWIGEDWNLWLRIAKNYEVKFVEEPLIKYRVHGNNLHRDMTKIEDSMRKNVEKNIEKHRLILRRKAYSYIYIDIAHEYIDTKNDHKMFINALKSIITYPLKSYSGDDKYKILCKHLIRKLF